MAQSANTYLEPTHHHGTIKKMEDIRWTDKEKDEIRQEFMKCFTIATKAQRITDKPNVNPTFNTVEELMTLLMGLEERREEVRDDMCYFLQYEIDYAYDRRFHDEIVKIRDITDAAVEKTISKSREFLQNIDDIDGSFASHQNECNETIESIRYYTERGGNNEPSAKKILTKLVDDLARRYKNMKTAWSKLIQCAIDYDNSTVFHVISEKVWTTSDAVDAATNEARRTIRSKQPTSKTPTERNPTLTDKMGGGADGIESDRNKRTESNMPTHTAEETYGGTDSMEQAIEQSESPDNNVSKNVPNPTTHMDMAAYAISTEEKTEGEQSRCGEKSRGAESKSKDVGAEGGGMVVRYDRSDTDGRRIVEIENPNKIEPDANERSHTEAEVKKREKSLENLGNAVEEQWSSIEEAWDIVTTQLPNEQSVREMEIPLKMAEAMLKRTIQTAERMANGSDKKGARNPDRETRGNNAIKTGSFEKSTWLNSTRYVWQPGTDYVNNKKEEPRHSRHSELKESSSLKKKHGSKN